MNYKNTRKIPGAYVWHNEQVMRITNQRVESGFVLVENFYQVNRKNLRLVKIGDEVIFKNVDILPPRCRQWGVMKIASFAGNDLIRTDKDESGSGYGHFRKPLFACALSAT
jgi:hypothetical protein